MDLQGTPIGLGPRSTKVTTDPAAQQPIEEPAGPVPTGSLAAESVRQGGAFSQNRGAQPEDISASQLKNTNSASSTLPSAPVGGLRENRQAQEKYPEALGGQGNFPGAHSSNGYAGGPTGAKQNMGMNDGNQARASGSSQHKHTGGQAPSYVADVTDGYKHTKPDGRNIGEGGFSSDDKNASFGSEIGSEQDPARAAINKFQRTNAKSAPDAGVPRQKGVNTETPFDVLESDQRA